MSDVALWQHIVYGVIGAVVVIGMGWVIVKDTFHDEPEQLPDDAGHDGGGFF